MTHTTSLDQPRPVPTHPGYSAFADGTIIHTRINRPLKRRRHKRSGYYDVQPQVNGKQRRVRVHAMVLAAFRCPRPKGLQCRHLDGDKSNNSIDNLAWGTPMENYLDQVDHGTARGPAMVGLVGEEHPAHRITEEAAEEIKMWAGTGEKYAHIAARYGVSPSLVGLIARGEVWGHLPGSLGLRLLLEERQKRQKIAA